MLFGCSQRIWQIGDGADSAALSNWEALGVCSSRCVKNKVRNVTSQLPPLPHWTEARKRRAPLQRRARVFLLGDSRAVFTFMNIEALADPRSRDVHIYPLSTCDDVQP